MDEQEVRKIVQEEIAKAAQSAQYGVTRTPIHTHNGIDTPTLQASSVGGFLNLTGAGTTTDPGVLASAVGQYIVGPPSQAIYYNPATTVAPVLPTIVTYPIPVIYGHGVGVASAFNGGQAPVGTVVFFDNGITLSNLWIRTENGWYGINVDTLI